MIKFNIENIEAKAKEHYNALKQQIQKNLNDVKDGKIIGLKKPKNKEKENELKEKQSVYSKLFADNCSFFEYIIEKRELIISGNLSELKKFSESLNTNYSNLLQNDDIKKILLSIFNYEQFKESKNYCAFDFAKKLGVRVCPYCNRSYVFGICKEGTRLELDHYYPKSAYPYLAISFYNLIPSCASCNRIKNDSDGNQILYPYEEGFENDYMFNVNGINAFSIKNYNSKLCANTKIINIEKKNYNLSKNKETKCKKNMAIFNLENLYSCHYPEAEEIIIKSHLYHKINIQSMEENFGISREEYIKYILGSDTEKDFSKQILSKFRYDIGVQLGVISEDYK